MIIIVAININGRAIFPIATIALTVDTSSVVCMIPKTLIFNGTLIMSVFTSSKLASALIIAFLIKGRAISTSSFVIGFNTPVRCLSHEYLLSSLQPPHLF